MAALDDSPRPGKEPTITDDARAWLVSLACQKAKERGISARALDNAAAGAPRPRARRRLPDIPAWRASLKARSARSSPITRCKPHKVRYYLERRDEAFETEDGRSALRLSRGRGPARERRLAGPNVAIISYDEKPGIQAIGNTAPDLPPQPGSHASFARDHEYKRHGTLSLLAGIDLLTGKVHACVENRHRSREFIGFLKKLDAAYPADTAIKLILDNHSAHISKETKKWLAAQPEGRFTFVFTPKHGSWLNLVEGFFSKMARSMLRHIRVASKAELKARILAYLDDLNREPVVHTWTYKIDAAA